MDKVDDWSKEIKGGSLSGVMMEEEAKEGWSNVLVEVGVIGWWKLE